MSNLLNENKITIFARNLSFEHKLLITVSVLGICFFFWLFYFYLPVQKKINEQKILINNITANRNNSLNSLADFDEIKRKNDFLINQQAGLLQKQIKESHNLNYVLNLLDKHFLEFQEVIPAKSKNEGFFEKEYYTFKVVGNFSNLLNFLHELEKSCKNIQFKVVTLDEIGEGRVLLHTQLKIIKFIG